MTAKRELYVAPMNPKDRILRDPVILQRQKEALLHVLQTGAITRPEYAEMFDVSPSTAWRDLQELLIAGWLALDGSGRATCYVPGSMMGRGGGEQRVMKEDGSGEGCLHCA